MKTGLKDARTAIASITAKYAKTKTQITLPETAGSCNTTYMGDVNVPV